MTISAAKAMPALAPTERPPSDDVAKALIVSFMGLLGLDMVMVVFVRCVDMRVVEELRVESAVLRLRKY